MRTELEQHPRWVLTGDYNTTFDHTGVGDPVGLKDTLHCTGEERHELRALPALGG